MNLFNIKKYGKDFWIYRIAILTSSLGDVLVNVAFSLWFINTYGAAKFAFMVAPLMALDTIMTPLLAPLADRYDRRKILAFSTVMQAVLVLVIAGMIYFHKYTYQTLLLVFILEKIFDSLSTVSLNGFLTFIMKNEDFSDGLKISNLLNSAVSLFGGMLAVGLYQMISVPLIIVIDSITFLLVAVCMVFISSTQKIVKSKLSESSFSLWKNDIKTGFKLVNKLNVFKWKMGMIFFLNFMGASVGVLLNSQIEKKLLPEWLLGVTSTFSGIGSLLAVPFLSLVLKRVKGDISNLLILTLFSLSFLTIGIINNQWVFSVCITLITMSTATFSLISNSTSTIAIPTTYRSRIGSLINTVGSLSFPASSFITGLLLEHGLPANQIIYIFSFCGLISVIVLYFAKDLRRLYRSTPAECESFIKDTYGIEVE